MIIIGATSANHPSLFQFFFIQFLVFDNLPMTTNLNEDPLAISLLIQARIPENEPFCDHDDPLTEHFDFFSLQYRRFFTFNQYKV